ncbi:MAG: hypothetical protein DRJ64_00880 [Thermoprotei archaeon]|nr:MAG: hypothetical protein DRJ64_00880 [Thermoprotei archaeon]
MWYHLRISRNLFKSFGSILEGVIIVIIVLTSSIGVMSYITLNYSETAILKGHLALLLIVYSSIGTSYGVYVLINSKIKPKALVFSTLFGALLASGVWWGMLFPSFLYKIVPIMSALTFYLPAGIIYGALVSSLKPEETKATTFYMMLVYGIVSELIYPNVFWILYYTAWGGLTQFSENILKRTRNQRITFIFSAFLFGALGASLAKSYIIVNWGGWDPLFKSVPATFFDGIFSALGASFGVSIGKKIQSLAV